MVTPRTSQRVVWKDREPDSENNGGGREEAWSQGSTAFVHQDGTINREPEGFFQV